MRSLRGFFLLVAVLCAPSAYALDPGQLSFVYAAAGGKALPGSITGAATGRTFGSLASGAATVADQALAKVGGLNVAMTATRAIPLAGLLTAAARALPYLSAGMLAYDLYESVRCHSTPDGSTGLLCDGGLNKQMQTTYYSGCFSSNPGTCVNGNAVGSNAAEIAKRAGTWTDGNGWTYSASPESGPSCGNSTGICIVIARLTPAPGNPRSNVVQVFTKQALGCPPYTLTDPHIFPSPSADGKCPSGVTYPVPLDTADTFAEPYADKTRTGDIARVIAPYADLAPLAAPPILTGPATVTDPQTQTQTHTDPKTGAVTNTTTTTVYNITYSGDAYTYNTTTTTVNPDGSTDTKTGQPAPAPTPDPEQVPAPVDSTLPDLPRLYTPVYPNGFAGVWQTDSAALQSTPMMAFLSSLKPSFSDGGCPVWTLPRSSVLGIQVGGDMSVSCAVWGFIRLAMIVSALLLARAVIFGG